MLRAIREFTGKKILVIGDIMLDQYTFGDVSRISPEAPIPILRKIANKFVPGGAANVANGLVSLGAKVVLCGVVGNDHSKDILFDILKDEGIDTSAIYIHRKNPTILKHRFIAGGYHQLLRVDIERTDNLEAAEEKKLIHAVEKAVIQCDVIIFSDYAKGLFSSELTPTLIKIAKKHKKKIVADIKPSQKSLFKGVDVITPNLKEAKEMSGLDDLGAIGESLITYFGSEVLITRSEEGMSVFRKDGSRKDFPTRKIKVFDVSGAGDTVIAVVTLGLISGLALEESAFLANIAGGIVVQKPGTAAVTREELESALQHENHLEAVEIVPKVWGHEKWLENNEKYCSKLLSLKKGYQCSLHYHKIKDEMFLVTKGHIRLELGKRILHMREGSFVRIPPRTLHRFRGIEDSAILEISTHHSEEDSYRIEESKKVLESTMKI